MRPAAMTGALSGTLTGWQMCGNTGSWRSNSIGKVEKDLQLSNGSICKWNENEPGIRKVQKVAEYLGVSIEELLREDDGKGE